MIKQKKPYTWEEIREFLIGELRKTKHIMTFGTIGSCNVERDIDIIITKKPKSKTSDFYKEIHKIFDNLNSYLYKKHKVHSFCFSYHGEEFLIRNLSKTKNKDLAFHTMPYTSYPQIEKDWNWSLFEDINMKDVLLKNYSCLIGSVEDLFSKEFQKKSYYNPAYLCLSLFNKINSNYPENLLIEEMNHHYDYVFRKLLGLKALKVKNEKEVRKVFYKLCDTIDKLQEQKNDKK